MPEDIRDRGESFLTEVVFPNRRELGEVAECCKDVVEFSTVLSAMMGVEPDREQ
jgi:hypothetical protein